MNTILLSLALISNSLTISPIGITAHGTAPERTEAEVNKIDKKGIVAYNPMISILYRTEQWQFSTAAMKDCDNNPAGYLVFGPYWKLGRYFTWGATIGAYVRQTQEDFIAGSVRVQQKKLPLSYRDKKIEIAGMPSVTASMTIPVATNFGLEVNAASNGMLNHFQLGLKWGF